MNVKQLYNVVKSTNIRLREFVESSSPIILPGIEQPSDSIRTALALPELTFIASKRKPSVFPCVRSYFIRPRVWNQQTLEYYAMIQISVKTADKDGQLGYQIASGIESLLGFAPDRRTLQKFTFFELRDYWKQKKDNLLTAPIVRPNGLRVQINDQADWVDVPDSNREITHIALTVQAYYK